MTGTPTAIAASAPATGQAVLDAVPCLILAIDLADGTVHEVNAAFAAVLGRERTEVVGRRWEQLFETDDQETLRAALAVPGRPALGAETSLRACHGERRRVLWSIGAASPGSHGEGLVVLSGIDVTPELRTSGLFSQLVRTTTAPALIGTDLHGRVNLYNTAAERMLGYPAHTVLGRVLDIEIFDQAELAERAHRLGVPPDLRLFTADLSKLDRRRSNPDLGALDRRRRQGDPQDDQQRERRRGERRAGDRTGGPPRGPPRGG